MGWFRILAGAAIEHPVNTERMPIELTADNEMQHRDNGRMTTKGMERESARSVNRALFVGHWACRTGTTISVKWDIDNALERLFDCVPRAIRRVEIKREINGTIGQQNRSRAVS